MVEIVHSVIVSIQISCYYNKVISEVRYLVVIEVKKNRIRDV